MSLRRYSALKNRLLPLATLRTMAETYTKHALSSIWNFTANKQSGKTNINILSLTTPDGTKIRDNKLFDEQLLKGNIKVYYTLGSADTRHSEIYSEYDPTQASP